MSEPTKLCKDCMHLRVGGLLPGPTCTRPTERDDLIFGGKAHVFEPAERARLSSSGCGPDARSFEPRPHPITERTPFPAQSLWRRFINRLNRPTNSTGPGCPVRRNGAPS